MGTFESNIKRMEANRDVDGLINALKHKNEDVQVKAVEALIKIGDERAVDPLMQYLKGAKEWVLMDVARFFREIGKKPDKFDLVYRASCIHEEIHYEGRDVEEVIEKLRTVAIPQTPIITELQVRSQYNALRKSWPGIALKKGTLEELLDAIRPRLKRDSKSSRFDGFQLITYYDHKASQVESGFEGATPYVGTFIGYRVWRTEKALFFSFSKE